MVWFIRSVCTIVILFIHFSSTSAGIGHPRHLTGSGIEDFRSGNQTTARGADQLELVRTERWFPWLHWLGSRNATRTNTRTTNSSTNQTTVQNADQHGYVRQGPRFSMLERLNSRKARRRTNTSTTTSKPNHTTMTEADQPNSVEPDPQSTRSDLYGPGNATRTNTGSTNSSTNQSSGIQNGDHSTGNDSGGKGDLVAPVSITNSGLVKIKLGGANGGAGGKGLERNFGSCFHASMSQIYCYITGKAWCLLQSACYFERLPVRFLHFGGIPTNRLVDLAG